MKTTGVVLGLAFLLTACGSPALESAGETCLSEHEQRQNSGEDSAGTPAISIEDDGDAVLIAGSGNSVQTALRVFNCMAKETEAPASLDQKVSSTTGADGRQSDTYDGIDVSWTYSAVDPGSFEAVFEVSD